MTVTTVAIDLAKDVFELAFADAQGRIVERKRKSGPATCVVFTEKPDAPMQLFSLSPSPRLQTTGERDLRWEPMHELSGVICHDCLCLRIR